MKIRRTTDGKVYAVHKTRQGTIAGVPLRVTDVLVTGRFDPDSDDTMESDRPGKVWLDGYMIYRVSDDTPVDVP
jgi:hypothetical protein